jgi:hypothetical protein
MYVLEISSMDSTVCVDHNFGHSLFNKITSISYIEKWLIYIVVVVHLDGQLDDIQHLIHLQYFISILSLSFM